MPRRHRSYWQLALLSVAALGLGCQMFSDHLTRWKMLDSMALEEPLLAVGGDGILFVPKSEGRLMTRDELSLAKTQELINYYSPILVQQRLDPNGQPFPYPKEYDLIGEASLRMDAEGKFQGVISGPPKLYSIFQKREINGAEHVQITYTAWYPAHPRLKTIDLESANIDSCVLRITLDREHVPVCYETISASGGFHKVFVTRWVEDAARATFGYPEAGKTYSIERATNDKIDWEVAGIVEEPRDQPSRPVVFIRAGDHRVLGLGNRLKLKIPAKAEVRTYEVADYADLYAVPVVGNPKIQKMPFFDLEDGGKVYGAERKERYLYSVVGVDAAGQPRANNQIKLHFDQTDWDDTSNYVRFLRLPPGALGPSLVKNPSEPKVERVTVPASTTTRPADPRTQKSVNP